MDMKGRRGKQAYQKRGGGIRWEEGSIDVLGLFQKKKDYAYKNFRVVQDKGEMHVIGVVMGDYVLALLPTRMSAQISIPPIRLFIHQQVVMQQVSWPEIEMREWCCPRGERPKAPTGLSRITWNGMTD